MRDEEDNLLDDYDLSAWEAPPPATGLADAVIARLDGAGVGVSAVAPVDTRAARSWWLLSGAAAAVLVASIGTWAALRSTSGSATPTAGETPSDGAVIADRPRHVAIPGGSAELELGADIRWHRTGDVTHIDQRKGTAMWRVDPNNKLVIEVGAMVASVDATGDATGASLRVEDPVNLTDTRVISASALTAAAIAMVTVIVYEGHVKTTAAGQTVVVQPGSTVEISPGQPPRPPAEPIAVGGAMPPSDVTPPAKIRRNDATPSEVAPKDKTAARAPRGCDADGLRQRGADAMTVGLFDLAFDSFDGSVRCKPDAKVSARAVVAACRMHDLGKARIHWPQLHADGQAEVLQTCVASGFSKGKLDGTDPETSADALAVNLDRAAISAGVASVKDQIAACGERTPVKGLVKVHVKVTPAGAATAELVGSPDVALGQCVVDAVDSIQFAETRGGGSFSYPFSF